MVDDELLMEKDDHICTLIINRPERRNSLSPELLLQLGDTLHRLAEEREIRVVIIRGAGEKAFSAGYDIGRIEERAKQEDEDLVAEEPSKDPLTYGMASVVDYPFPVIAMVYGFCVGAGLELAVTCDLRFVANTARLGITPAKLGVVYSFTGIQKFLNLVGIARTKELFFTGKLVDAPTAQEMGLVDHVVPERELEFFTYDFAREVAENAPISVSGTKLIINKLLGYQRLSAEDEAEMRALRVNAFRSEDVKEGQRAFREKRKPRFVGR